ncbi:mannose-P-dolichol utilization defect 1 protein [Wolfiporia cocos MD-104 SS10]|uniref:Mannose-P-dolichol utilization defect 1 protein homolog n=1 Tax=Wolfiporia cocos (strain MD-104) TaxID=742152 RepID=A0A2H3JMD7_WOLCO|nr:mannose-P-dolichol utilization defect 1 protein [Wolfiporia cocos MD-104 SS10]
MTTITRNLPWFIKDLGVSIVGQKCYASLVENLDFGDVDCIKYSLSKGLGVGIVVGGSIMKVPQLLLIVSARSARGLSLPAYVLETLSYAITLAYSYRNEFPFSTYGENLFLALQNAIITLLIIHYPSSRQLTHAQPTTLRVLSAAALMLLTALAFVALPAAALAPLQLATLPLSLFSKLPQIRQNHRARSTGQLSAFAVVAQIGGCLARLFTTATEVGDPLVSAGFALALLLNCVLGAQMWMYWGQEEKEELSKVSIGHPADEKPRTQWRPPSPPVEVVVPPASPSTRQPSGRKWARKVD